MFVKCDYCGKDIERHRKQNHYFCTRKCFGNFYRGKPHWWAYKQRTPVPRVIVECVICGIKFRKLETSNQKFCSWACVIASRKNKFRRDITLTCKGCRKEFVVQDNKIGRLRKYCSRECAGKDLRIWYIPNKYPSDWGKRVEIVRAKSGGVCPLCSMENNTGYPFPVHHKIPPRYFIVNPERAHEPDNLIAICGSCHSRIDRRRSPKLGGIFVK